MNQFRTLNADEIECRVQKCNKDKGVSLLLYKDARADMIILDETVGAMNWMRRHERDNANCIVSIWDADKHQWISKEDTGTESNTEAEKGLASDSFKRACVNWGIGRELYTAPFVWVPANKIDWMENGKPKSTFRVTHIEYDEKRRINCLVINSEKGVVYEYYNNYGAQETAKNAEKKAKEKPADDETVVRKITSVQPEPLIPCPVCGKPVKAVKTRNGKGKSPEEVFAALGMCYDCYQQQGAVK